MRYMINTPVSYLIVHDYDYLQNNYFKIQKKNKQENCKTAYKILEIWFIYQAGLKLIEFPQSISGSEHWKSSDHAD